MEPRLYELHDMARERGVDGYRRMSKTELLEVVGGGHTGGPTTVERSVRGGLGLLTLRGGTPENTLALETLEELATAAEELAEIADRGGAALGRIEAIDVPTVAVLNGHAVGGGIDLALACDWRIGAEGARLRFIHNELGYSPPWGAAGRIARLLTAPVALRLFATCALVSMQEARDMGLVDDLGSPHRLLGRVEALLTRIERADRVAVMATKRLLRPDTPREAHSAAFAALWDARAATLPE
jgi:enoyl-CoA hydratase/carnithine racemase